MTRKGRLLAFLLANPGADYSDLEAYQKTEPSLRLRKVGTTSVQINLSEKGGWIDPESWANNYIAGLKMHAEQALKELQEAGGSAEELQFVSAAISTYKETNEKLKAQLEEGKRKWHFTSQMNKRLITCLREIQKSRDNTDGLYPTGRQVYERLLAALNPSMSMDKLEETLSEFKTS